MTRIAALAAAALIALGAQAQEAVRPEVGKPLQAAQALIKAGKYKEALAKVGEADAAGGKNAAESLTIERMRIAAASGAGDAETAAKAFEVIAASGKVGAPDKARMAESITANYYRNKDYGKAMQWGQRYFREGGTSPAMRTLLIQSQYLSGDFSGAIRELTAEVQAAEKSGAAPAEDRLKLLLNAALQQKDSKTYVHAVEKLVTHYPKKEYWADLLSRIQGKPSFSDRLVLDVYRLKLATDGMATANDFMEMSQLALQAGHAAEAQQVVAKGFSAGALGQGPQAERHQRLRDLVTKRLAEEASAQAGAEKLAAAEKNGTALLNLGFSQVFAGQAAKGIALMQQGIAQGGLKRPEDAKLHLGIAHFLAGDAAKAQAVFKTVEGADGTADLARLWSLHARRKP